MGRDGPDNLCRMRGALSPQVVSKGIGRVTACQRAGMVLCDHAKISAKQH